MPNQTPRRRTRLCTAGAAACNGDLLSTCNADGSGYLAGGTDCSTSKQLCYSAACADQAVETIVSNTGSSRSFCSYYAKLNFYKVTFPRTLQVIQQYLSVSAGMTLTWVVLESATQTGTYTSVLTTSTSSSSAILGYVSSGTLATPVKLRANYYYAIGVFWGSGSGVSYYSSSATLPLATSFGSLVSSVSLDTTVAPTSISYSSNSSSAYPQRLMLTP